MILPQDIFSIADRLDSQREELELLAEEKAEQLDELQTSEQPNEVKISILELQLGILEDALSSIEEAISTLNDYA